jgi:uncharacterized protein YhaN
MRLSSFHIDGFGALAGTAAEEITPGLVVVLGPNEAGKSTLFDFLSGVLFGFPSRKDSPRFHAPVRGGRHGGRVGFVDDSGGRWVVERHAGAQRGLEVRLPDGSEGDERSLSRALAGASAALFEAVFAVGLDDLGHMKNLESDEVRELLFAASILGQRRTATKAMKHLAEVRDELARPRREDATANRLAAQLEQLRAELTSARQEAARYEGLQHQAAAADDELAAMRRQLKALRDNERELEVLAGCWQHFRRAETAEEELRALPPPGHGAALLEQGAAIRELADERSGHFERVEKLAELQQQRRSIEISIERRLSVMGPGWTREQAAGAPDPDILAENARGARERLNTLRTGVASAQAVLAQAEHLLRAAGGATTTDVVPDRRQLEELTTATSELRERLGEAERLQLEVLADERSLALDRSARAAHDRAGRSAALALLVCGLAVCVLGVALIAGGQRGPAGAAGAVGLVLLAAGGLVWRARGRHGARGDTGSAAAGAGSAPASARAATERAMMLERTRARIEVLASELGLGLPASRVDLDRLAATLQRQSERRRQLDDQVAARAEAEARVATAAEAVRQAIGALSDEQDAHEAWCAGHGFAATGRPDAALEAIAELAELRERLQDLGRIEKGIADLEPSVTSFETRCHRLFEAIGPALIGESPTVVATVGGTAPGVPAEVTLIELVRRLEEAIGLDARRSALRREASEAESALETALGAGETGERLRSKLAGGDVLAWSSEREALEPAIHRLEQAEEDTVRRHQSLAEEMRRLATSDRIADLERRQEALEVELDATLHRYLVLGAARALLQRTLGRHERERQPAVVARAAAHFARVTGGRYVGLLADAGIDGRQTIRVLSTTGEAIDATSLSRGTIEQLYLCLRLGLADSFAERSVSLPIVLDDVLVNFDPERATTVAAELAETARSHQVVFLTCHPHLAETVLRAAGQSQVESQLIQLGRLGEPAGKVEQLALAALAALPDLPSHTAEADEAETPAAERQLPTLRPAVGETPRSS